MLEKELEEIIIKEKSIITFLKKLSPKDKRELVPFLKKLKERVFELKTIEEKSKWGLSYTYEHTHTEKQRALMHKACYVCFNKTDIKRALFNVSNLSVSDDYLKNIIPWYTPNWYGDLINEDMPWELTYDKTMRLCKDGLLEPSHALLLNKLPSAIVEYEWKDKKRLSYYKPEVLFNHKKTLDEHIWLLFEEDSSINNYYNYLHLENYKGGNDIWIDTICNLVHDEKLNRKKVLRATIYTSTKGFNKTLSGWFFDLLLKLNLTEEEILSLQNELFAALNSPHSKVINTVLKYFKSVSNLKKFKHKTFIENSSLLLNSETKSVVNSTLMILDKIAKIHPSSKLSACQKASEALINIDEKIQLRAAKIIEKYGNPKKVELLDEINLYADNLFYTSKEVLHEYLTQQEEVEAYNYEVEESKVISEENKLSSYKTFDELIFFVSQALDNNEVYHIDLLLSYLPKLNVLLNKDNVGKLEPIFKRSFDLSMSFDWNSQIGNLESEAALYMNDFAEILMRKFPAELDSFRKAKDKKIKKLKEDRYYSSHYKQNLKEIEKQPIPDYIYQIHHFLFIKSKALIKKSLTLELLSTPTHSPCWIDPKVLIERILAYERSNEVMDLYDFQLALGRLPINNQGQDVTGLIQSIKDEDSKKILQYHFNLLDINNEKITRPELWLQSVLSRNKDSEVSFFQEYLANSLQKEKGAYVWDCEMKDHFYKEYDYSLGKQVQKKMVRKELGFKDFNLQKAKPDSLVDGLKGFFGRNKKTIKINSIYNYIHFKKQKYYTTIQPNDEIKFLYLSPNNPSMFLSHVIHNNLKESTFFDESSKKNMVNLLKGLHEIWIRPDFKESTYLFLASGLLCSDKVSRELAAEVWIKASAEGNMNSLLLGQIVGKLQKGEYAPLKRFTDLMTMSLFNVSKGHNESLYRLLDNMIGNMNNVPIRGVKKLLEIFLELKRSFPRSEISELSLEKLSVWQETKTIKSVINKIIQ
ncbi:hypothetical protein FEE95_13915 [Maribacter algarum]|uniref:Uncharacterized protein n=1 Tax=Maribacter algarum (ex Zhang et al. 2020) TaxID=2578118 RepID=A0A5S3PMN4_9FLAO|nr:DUF6493 family protein [Maribacter algarum]TMM55753.1 hypothetical protein FEE95_13915 [Maribacter algarum]